MVHIQNGCIPLDWEHNIEGGHIIKQERLIKGDRDRETATQRQPDRPQLIIGVHAIKTINLLTASITESITN